jgi:serine/threonine protein kinase
MKCATCGQDNKPDARFCAHCGALLDTDLGSLQAGQLVDSDTYRIVRPLGKGGMGAVFLAANTKAFDRPCVVKEVIEYYDANSATERQKAVERFESEARTLASLKHPGIPDIYSYFSERGSNYLVMEYIEGSNLAEGLTHEENGQAVQGRPLPIEEAMRYTIEICEVLIYLEQLQPPVIHNDIKPGNIILDQNGGRAVLVDFGTAKTRYARPAAGQPGRQQSSVYGTVGYAAPELYDGRAEPRSDVHALAATAYHLLTDDDPRDHPFSFPQLVKLPDPLRTVLREALDPDVAKRPTAVQFRQRLQQALLQVDAHEGQAQPIPAVSPGPVDQAPARGAPASVPDMDITPELVDLGTFSDDSSYTEIASFNVQNRGSTAVQCQIEGTPEWLTIYPQTFRCPPGRTQEVKLRGQVYKLPAGENTPGATLQVKFDGSPFRPVQVTLRKQGAEKKPTRWRGFLMISFALLVLAAAILFVLLLTRVLVL